MSSPAISDLRGLPRVIITLPDFSVIQTRDPLNPYIDYPGTMEIKNGYDSKYPDNFLYNGSMMVKISGNGTATGDKKPLGISTTTSTGGKNLVPLLGMGQHNKWRLLAMAVDKSNGREQFAFSLARRLPLAWGSRSRHVEVWYNISGTETYQGLYLLTETCKQGTDRIDVSGAGSFVCESVVDYTVKDPDDLAVMFTMNQVGGSLTSFLLDYKGSGGSISTTKEHITGFETALAAAYASKDYSAIWSQWLDLESTVAFIFQEEMCKNFEGPAKGFRLCRDKVTGQYQGKMFFVPWDFDLSQGGSQGYILPEGLIMNIHWYFSRFYSDPIFYSALSKMIQQYTALVYKNIAIREADWVYLQNTGAPDRNYALWGYIYGVLTVQDASPAHAVKRHVTWLKDRICWLRNAFPLLTLPQPSPEAVSIVKKSPNLPPNLNNLLIWFDFSFNPSVLNAYGSPAGFYEPVKSFRNLANGSKANQENGSLWGRYLPYSGEKYLHISPVSGHYASISYNPIMDIAGDIVMEFLVAPLSWTPSSPMLIASRGPWAVYILPSGQIKLSLISDSLSTVPIGIAGRLKKSWIRICRSAVGEVNFFTSSNGIIWTELGAPVPSSGGLIDSSTANIELGSSNSGLIDPLYKFNGKIYALRLISGPPSGTVVVDWHAADSNHLDYSNTERSNGLTVTYGYRCWLIGRSCLVVDPKLNSMGYNLETYVSAPAAYTSAILVGSRAQSEPVIGVDSAVDIAGYAGPVFIGGVGNWSSCNGVVYGVRNGRTITNLNRSRFISSYPGGGTNMLMRQNSDQVTVVVSPLVSASKLERIFYTNNGSVLGGAYGKFGLWNTVQDPDAVDKWLLY